MAGSRYSIEQKLSVIRMMEAERYTWKEIEEDHHVSENTLLVWKAKFDISGIDAVKESKTWNPYTKEQKIAAVRDYIDGATTIEVLFNHQISDGSVLRKWIKKYTSHRELTDSRKGMDRAMAKGRKTTFEERIEIVRYCLDNGRPIYSPCLTSRSMAGRKNMTPKDEAIRGTDQRGEARTSHPTD